VSRDAIVQEDVHQCLRLQLDDARAQLDRFGQRFWSLTRFMLDGRARCYEDVTRRATSGRDRLSMGLFDAAVDLNPHWTMLSSVMVNPGRLRPLSSSHSRRFPWSRRTNCSSPP
jgi:hypothetical protein